MCACVSVSVSVCLCACMCVLCVCLFSVQRVCIFYVHMYMRVCVCTFVLHDFLMIAGLKSTKKQLEHNQRQLQEQIGHAVTGIIICNYHRKQV